jgi:gluconolactonase
MIALAVLIVAVCALCASIAAPGAELEKLAGGFDFTEGASSDSEGNIFFTDQPNDRLMKFSVGGELTEFMSPCGRANGTCFDGEGNIWTCSDDRNELWRIAPDGAVTVVVTGYEGKLLNGPNDVWLLPDGGLFITDPFYARSYWNRGPKEQACEGVYYLAPGGGDLKPAISNMVRPNGIVGTPGGKTLYVSDIGAGKTHAYDVEPDGSLVGERVFCGLGSDGMTIDSDGNVYLTGHGVTVFNSAGEQIDHIDVPERWTGNICFGGRDRNLLFITASTSVYGLKTVVRGNPPGR